MILDNFVDWINMGDIDNARLINLMDKKKQIERDQLNKFRPLQIF